MIVSQRFKAMCFHATSGFFESSRVYFYFEKMPEIGNFWGEAVKSKPTSFLRKLIHNLSKLHFDVFCLVALVVFGLFRVCITFYLFLVFVSDCFYLLLLFQQFVYNHSLLFEAFESTEERWRCWQGAYEVLATILCLRSFMGGECCSTSSMHSPSENVGQHWEHTDCSPTSGSSSICWLLLVWSVRRVLAEPVRVEPLL